MFFESLFHNLMSIPLVYRYSFDNEYTRHNMAMGVN